MILFKGLRPLFFTAGFLVTCVTAVAHEDEPVDTNQVYVCTAREWLSKGHFGGRVRKFFMATVNDGTALDYWTWAAGAGLHYQTARYKGFSVALEGIFTFRLYGNDLNKVDPASGKISRFERQLYDLEQPYNFNDLDRLEELYADYRDDFVDIKLGRMAVHTPIVNPHDGRMKPKVVEGIWGEFFKKNWKLSSGWFVKASPRSTTHWHTLGEAIGIYNNGCLNDIPGSNYRHHVNTRGLGILGVEYKNEDRRFSSWAYLIENVSNTVLTELKVGNQWSAGVMALVQHQVGNGGNEILENAYHPDSQATVVFSGMIEHKWEKGWRFTLAATHVTDQGTYRFPREIGVDPFYTHLTRGWVEGLSNATTATVKGAFKGSHWKVEAGVQHFTLHGDIDDFETNKYGIANHWQSNLEVHYHCQGWLEGLEWMVLYVNTLPDAGQELPAGRIQNRLNMHHLSVVANLRF